MITQPHQTKRHGRMNFIEWRLLVWGSLGGLLLTCLALGIGLIIRPDYSTQSSTPVLTMYPGPTSTWTPVEYTETPPPTAASPLPPSTSQLDVGAFVSVSGTEGSGLRMRDAPGLDATIIRLAVESEVFQIEDGPRDVDGYIWWLVVNPYDTQITGWVVSNYLRLVEDQ